MPEHDDFATLVQLFMRRARRSDHALASLTGIPARTIEKWRHGAVRRPRHVTDLLKLAHALALDAGDTTRLLRAADHLPLEAIRRQAQRAQDAPLLALLDAWPAPASNGQAGGADPAPPARTDRHHQLRPPVTDFVGRAREVDRMAQALQAASDGGAAVISGVRGMGGIGKTELAYAVACELDAVFPDAQIMLDLEGTNATPLTPTQALQAIIRAFLPDTPLPEDLAALQARYRSVLHTRRVLILADDAREAAQVGPLMPPAGCALLVTSRQRFSLPGMTTVDLDHLTEAEAIALLQSICDRLSTAEARAIARACGHLRLAVRVSGSILHNTPALSVERYIQRLTDVRQRLRQLRDPDDPQLNVEASLMLSYTLLSDAAQRVFRQLGIFSADFSAQQAQAVVGAAELDVEEQLLHLLRRNLVLYDTQRARWRLHNLVRDVALLRLEEQGEAEATSWRYARAAVAATYQAHKLYMAGGESIVAALAQFDADRSHLDAALRWAALHMGAPDGDALLVDATLAPGPIASVRSDPQCDRMPLLQDALAAARRVGNRGGEGRLLRALGSTVFGVGDIRQALQYYEGARDIAAALGDRWEEAIAVYGVGLATTTLGERRQAIPAYEQALAIAREIGDPHCEAMSLNGLGAVYAMLGEPQRANQWYAEALTSARAIGNRRLEGYVLSGSACADATLGDLDGATSTFEQGLGILSELGDRYGAAMARWEFGKTLFQQGDRARALPLLRAAVAYEVEIGHAQADEHAALLARIESEQTT